MYAQASGNKIERHYLQHVEGFFKAEVYVRCLSNGQRIVCKDYSRFRRNPVAAFIAKRLVAREAKALQALQGWQYAPELLPSANELVLVQEYVEGQTLDSFPAKQAKRPMEPCLTKVLQEMHQKGIVHNDVRASNVIINQQGLPILVDFTSAHIFSSPHRKIARWLRYHDVRHALKLKNRLLGGLTQREQNMLVKPKVVQILQNIWSNNLLALLKRA